MIELNDAYAGCPYHNSYWAPYVMWSLELEARSNRLYIGQQIHAILLGWA